MKPLKNKDKKKFLRSSERGQALAEVALFSILAIIFTYGFLALIPYHRARTVAIASAYGCAQFLSQSPDPVLAAKNARQIANSTLGADWSATLGVRYSIKVSAPSAPGQPGTCSVSWSAPILFNGLLGLHSSGSTAETFTSRSETWKAKWHK